MHALAVVVFYATVVGAGYPSGVKDGDVIFQTSRSRQSLAVQRATHSPYSHMGVILIRDGNPNVFEAASTVRYTPFRDWVRRGTGGHFVVKRLAHAEPLLKASALRRLRATASTFEGRPYDPLFGWSNHELYCSELVWKLYENALGIELSRPRKVRDFDFTDPKVKRLAMQRYPHGIPLDEPAVAPADIFDSPLLITVLRQ